MVNTEAATAKMIILVSWIMQSFAETRSEFKASFKLELELDARMSGA